MLNLRALGAASIELEYVGKDTPSLGTVRRGDRLEKLAQNLDIGEQGLFQRAVSRIEKH